MKMFVIVDVGCIECGEQTEVVGVYPNKKEAKAAFDAQCVKLGIKDWKPRGGLLELGTLAGKKSKTTYRGGTGYFTGGQHALELHEVTMKEKR